MFNVLGLLVDGWTSLGRLHLHECLLIGILFVCVVVGARLFSI